MEQPALPVPLSTVVPGRMEWSTAWNDRILMIHLESSGPVISATTQVQFKYRIIKSCALHNNILHFWHCIHSLIHFIVPCLGVPACGTLRNAAGNCGRCGPAVPRIHGIFERMPTAGKLNFARSWDRLDMLFCHDICLTSQVDNKFVLKRSNRQKPKPDVYNRENKEKL